MHDENGNNQNPGNGYSEPVRSALDLIEGLLIEGIKHGHFDYSVTCETGTTVGVC